MERDALAQFGLTADVIEMITTGGVNEHWRVVAGGRIYALRCYNPRHAPAGTAFEHEVLAFIAGGGWPVAPPLPARDGRTVVDVGARRFALFPFLPGTSAPYGDAGYLHRKGRLLARLHRDLAAWPASAQRTGFGRVSDLDTYVQADGFATLDELLRWFGREHAALAAGLRAEQEASRDQLAYLGFDALPDALVHFEFHLNNLLFDDARLTGVLDFDFVHLDARVADLGRSVAVDCLDRSGRTVIDPRALNAFMGGYLTAGSLDAAELRLIVPAIRANMLWMTVLPLSLWAAGRNGDALPDIEHAVNDRFPALRHQASALEAAVMAAAERASNAPPGAPSGSRTPTRRLIAHPLERVQSDQDAKQYRDHDEEALHEQGFVHAPPAAGLVAREQAAQPHDRRR